MSNGSLQPRQTKTEKRDAAREKARQMRESQAKRDKRRRVLWQVGGIVGVVAVATAVFFGYQSWQQGQIAASTGPTNMLSDGLVVTSTGPVLTEAIPAGGKPVATTQSTDPGAVNITVYYDYLCPYCGLFEAANSAYIQQLVQNGATLEMHPIGMLDDYSERAANAFACVANYEPEVAVSFNALMFQNQPDERVADRPSNTQIMDLVKQAGATKTAEIDSCIKGNQFKNWVTAATNRAMQEEIPNSSLSKIKGTPTVLVNGVYFDQSKVALATGGVCDKALVNGECPADAEITGGLRGADAFKWFVLQTTSQAAATATPTPTPTP